MYIEDRNYRDTIDSINKLTKELNGTAFEDLSINELDNIISLVYGVLSDWSYLKSDIDKWIGILEDIEEK